MLSVAVTDLPTTRTSRSSARHRNTAAVCLESEMAGETTATLRPPHEFCEFLGVMNLFLGDIIGTIDKRLPVTVWIGMIRMECLSHANICHPDFQDFLNSNFIVVYDRGPVNS